MQHKDVSRNIESLGYFLEVLLIWQTTKYIFERGVFYDKSLNLLILDMLALLLRFQAPLLQIV
jgi:hypothetical protein